MTEQMRRDLGSVGGSGQGGGRDQGGLAGCGLLVALVGGTAAFAMAVRLYGRCALATSSCEPGIGFTLFTVIGILCVVAGAVAFARARERSGSPGASDGPGRSALREVLVHQPGWTVGPSRHDPGEGRWRVAAVSGSPRDPLQTEVIEATGPTEDEALAALAKLLMASASGE